MTESKNPCLYGVVHLKPLPGSPRFAGSMQEIIDAALLDVVSLSTGMDALMIENFGDIPFTAGRVPAETVAAMAVVGSVIARETSLPFGFNVLRNDGQSALALAAACEGSFVRINIHTGAMVTDQGLIQGQAFDTIRYRQGLCPEVRILADVHVKHASPLGAGETIEDAARDCLHRGLADALIVSGSGTGAATPLDDVRRVRAACPEAELLIGSGVTESTIYDLLEIADGVIVGTFLKRGGRVDEPVDPERVHRLRDAMDG